MGKMRGRILSLVALLAVATALFTVAGAPQARAAPDLTGVWTCDGESTYYLRQIGSTLWWYGELDPDTPSWSNVARGTIKGDTITLTWVDVPKGQSMSQGTLKMKIVSDNELQKISQTGGFGGSTWTRN